MITCREPARASTGAVTVRVMTCCSPPARNTVSLLSRAPQPGLGLVEVTKMVTLPCMLPTFLMVMRKSTESPGSTHLLGTSVSSSSRKVGLMMPSSFLPSQTEASEKDWTRTNTVPFSLALASSGDISRTVKFVDSSTPSVTMDLSTLTSHPAFSGMSV